jgi:disease resistance protein RPS2
MLREDAAILVEMMVQTWISEGLVKAKENVDYDYVLKTGESYVKLLENRCLFQVKGGVITVHDVVHDMAIYIGENEENCVLRAGQSLQHFPDIPASDNCRRISVTGNDIKSLPAELRCPNLVSLLMGDNKGLKEIPEAFFLNLTSLRVLDIHRISMRSLPSSLWQLTRLELLGLAFSEVEDISEEIGNLSYLQFLYLNFCTNIKSLPSRIGELKNLKHLNLQGCNTVLIPDEIRKLPNCEIVVK